MLFFFLCTKAGAGEEHIVILLVKPSFYEGYCSSHIVVGDVGNENAHCTGRLTGKPAGKDVRSIILLRYHLHDFFLRFFTDLVRAV